MRRRVESAAGDQPEKVHEPSQTPHQEFPRRDQRISVVVSDGNYMNSELLARALSRVKTLTVLKRAVNFSDTLEAIVDLRPDVAVLSTHLADGPYKGWEILRRTRELSVGTRCIVLMDQGEQEAVIDVFRAGARGIFRRSTPMHLLAKCISAVHSGQIWASNADLQLVLGALERAMPFRYVNSRGEALLTSREQELVPLVAHGLTNKEISARLCVSEHTIKNHLFRIYEKLGISSRVELILYAVSERGQGRKSA